MSTHALIEKRLGKSLESVTKEELINLLQEIETEKKEMKKQRKYGLVWEEQVEEVEQFLKANYPVLTEVKEREIRQDPTKPTNLLIEGDNLHSLQTLQYTHKGKVDVIYIDPPYNTGNKDFVYNDRYVDKEDSWRHSSWLSFMDKRLRLARELLADDGVVFISIDDNEQAQLKLLCDQVFGEKNFVANFIWQKKNAHGTDSKNISVFTEYVICYGKNTEKLKLNRMHKPLEGYINSDKHEHRRGKYKLNKLDRGTLGYSKSLDFGIQGPDNELVFPNDRDETENDGWRWRWSLDKVKWGLENDFIEFKKNKRGRYSVYYKMYEHVDNENQLVNRENILPYSNIFPDSVGGTSKGTALIKEVLGGVRFNYAKSKDLLKYIINLHQNKNSTILDFFAGSGTTGHAVLELNNEDSGNRSFILCTNNENNICEEVTYERLNRVINGYTTPKGKEVEGIPANLKYYRTEFVSKDAYTDSVKLQIARKSEDLLSIKENCFEPYKETRHYKILLSEKKALGICNRSLRTAVILDVQKELMELPQEEKILYVLSLEEGEELSYELQHLVNAGIQVKPVPKKLKEMFDQAF